AIRSDPAFRDTLPPSESRAFPDPRFREPETRRLPGVGNAGLRSPGRRQNLLLHAHAKQRLQQFLGVKHFGSKELLGVAGIRWDSRIAEGGAQRRPCSTHVANYPCRTKASLAPVGSATKPPLIKQASAGLTHGRLT